MFRDTKLITLAALVAMSLVLSACMAGKKGKGPGSYAIEQEVPQVIAVLPPTMSLSANATQVPEAVDPDEKRFITNLTRRVLQNHLTGKGYRPKMIKAVDRKLHDTIIWDSMSPKEQCKLLGVQGVVTIDVVGYSMLSAAALENFMLSANATMYDAGGNEIGSWLETAQKRDISVPTSVVGLIGTLAGAVLSDTPEKQFRHVAYDWGWKMSQIMPDCIKGQNLPEIMMVDTNVDVDIFGEGDRVAVKVFAAPDLIASFDIGHFRRNIPLKMVGDGEYEGYYVVRKNERAQGQQLIVRVAQLNGLEREWIEPEALVTIDGVPPEPPRSVNFRAQNDGVHMAWDLPEGEEVSAFIVERNETPVGAFAKAGVVEDTKFVDGEVEQGMTYYYRIRSVDRARNLSEVTEPREVVMPRFDELTIGGELSGSLITGKYFVEDAVVPAGEVLTVMRGTTLTFDKDAKLLVQGKLLVKGAENAPVVMTGEQWGGIVVDDGGEVGVVNTSLSGAAPMVASRGRLLLEHVNGLGSGQDGVVLKSGAFEITDADLTGWRRALVVEGAEGLVQYSALTGNNVGVAYASGEVELSRNAIHDNTLNIDARRKLAVRENYLGATVLKQAGVSDMVILKSVLDAPYPDGRIIALMEDADLTAEQIAKRFDEHKARGVELFQQRKYGDAYGELSKAVRVKEDRDTYLYLIYTQMELGDAERAETTMETAIKAFPYDFRLRQLHVQHLLGQGYDGRAMLSVDKALMMDPSNERLKMLKEYVIGEVKKMRSNVTAGSR